MDWRWRGLAVALVAWGGRGGCKGLGARAALGGAAGEAGASRTGTAAGTGFAASRHGQLGRFNFHSRDDIGAAGANAAVGRGGSRLAAHCATAAALRARIEPANPGPWSPQGASWR